MVVGWSLFRKKRFEINFFVQRNASKFAIFIDKENPCSFFRFSFRATLCFHIWMPWFMSINMANFEAFPLTKKLISNLFFLKSVVSCIPRKRLSYFTFVAIFWRKESTILHLKQSDQKKTIYIFKHNDKYWQ